MRTRPATLLIVAASLAALAAPASAAAGRLVVGISDQKPDMFTDPRFAALGITHARITVPWDVLTVDWQREEVDAWMAAARAAGAAPLVSFGRSRVDARRRVLPSPTRYRHEVRRFIARYPWVREYATWNEANHCGEPTCHRPDMVARYYRVLRTECPGCRVLAANLLDVPNMVAWVKAFQRRSPVVPRYWGLHNYVDANRFRTRGTLALLRATRGEVWFTETGGLVARRNRSRIPLGESPAHAARATRWVFDRLAGLSPRITRVYLYHWNTGEDALTWDSALIGPDGRTRPAFRVLERELGRLRLAAARHVTRRR